MFDLLFNFCNWWYNDFVHSFFIKDILFKYIWVHGSLLNAIINCILLQLKPWLYGDETSARIGNLILLAVFAPVIILFFGFIIFLLMPITLPILIGTIVGFSIKKFNRIKKNINYNKKQNSSFIK